MASSLTPLYFTMSQNSKKIRYMSVGVFVGQPNKLDGLNQLKGYELKLKVVSLDC